MPMIDVYAAAGTFGDQLRWPEPGHRIDDDRAGARYPDVPQEHCGLCSRTAAVQLSNVDGDTTYVRVQVLTNAGALDRDKQLAVVSRLTALVADAAGDPRSSTAPGSF